MLPGKSEGSTLFDSDSFIISNFEWNKLSLCESPSVYFGLLNDKSLILITSQVQVYLTQLEAFLYILEVKDFKQTKFSRTCVRNILLSADLFSIRQYVQSDNTCPTYGFRCVSSFPILFQYLVISFFNRLEFKFSCDRWNRKFRPRFEDFMIIIKASIFTACDQARGTNIKKRTTGRHTHTIQLVFVG